MAPHPKTKCKKGGVAYEAQIQFLTTGGHLSPMANGFRVENAGRLELRIVAATNYHGDDPHVVCEKQLASIKHKSYAALVEDHIAEHQLLFHRVALNLAQTKKIRRLGEYALKDMPTDKRLRAYRQGIEDPELIALYFHFGRYILITNSRPGTQAINLWGKWINTVNPYYNAD